MDYVAHDDDDDEEEVVDNEDCVTGVGDYGDDISMHIHEVH